MVGATGGDALGALIEANGSWAGVGTTAATTAAGAGAAGAAGAGAATAETVAATNAWNPVGWAAAAVAVISLLRSNGGTPTSNTGSASVNFDAKGNQQNKETFYGGSSDSTDKIIAGLESTYQQTAAALCIGTVATRFAYLGNTGKDGKSPNFGLSG